MTIGEWLKSGKKDYNIGVEIYGSFKGKDNLYQFFIQNKGCNEGSQPFNMLVQKIGNIHRIMRQQNQTVELSKSIGRNPVPIKVVEFKPTKDNNNANDIDGLRKNKKYVNKILALEWKHLQDRDRAVFFNNIDYFLRKQKLLFENSKKERELKSLHVDLKKSATNDERKDILQKAKILEKEQTNNWAEIDTWNQPEKKPKVTKQTLIEDGARKALRIGQLKGYIRKNENDLKNPDKKFSQKVRANKNLRLKKWRTELEKLENEIG